VVGVHAGLGFRFEHGLERTDAVADVLHVHGAAGVGHVHAGRSVAFHQLGLGGQLLVGDHVAHHQKASGVHAQLAGVFDVLFRDIRFGAMGVDPHHTSTGVVGGFQVRHRANTGQQQGGDFGVTDHIGRRFDPLQG
jgi:hypothetical protein